MSEQLDYYGLMRQFWDWAFENPEIVTPTHCAVYTFAVEHCNRLGWKEKFGLPSQMVMDAIGLKTWKSYIKVFNDLCEFGFFTLVQRSKNQYSSNIIAIDKKSKALSKALSKAMQKHYQKQSEYNKTNIQDTNIHFAPHTVPDEKSENKTEKLYFDFDKEKPKYILSAETYAELKQRLIKSGYATSTILLLLTKRWYNNNEMDYLPIGKEKRGSSDLAAVLDKKFNGEKLKIIEHVVELLRTMGDDDFWKNNVSLAALYSNYVKINTLNEQKCSQN